MTDNHNYSTPGQGTSDWHTPLNQNFERIDTDVEIRDTESALDMYTPKAGAKFFATDTGTVYLGDGTDWNAVEPTGQTPVFDSITASKVNEIRYVPSSEGGAGIQAAIDELSNGGKIVLSGAYTIHEPLELKSNVILEGDGRHNTTLKSTVDDDYAIKLVGTGDSPSEHVSSCQFRNLEIFPTDTTATRHGVLLKYSHDHRFRDVIIRDFNGEGLRQESDWELEMIGCRISDCGDLSSGTYAWHAQSTDTTQSNHTDVIASKIGGTADLLLLDDTHHYQFMNTKFSVVNDAATCITLRDTGSLPQVNRMFRFVNCSFFRDGNVMGGTGFNLQAAENVVWIGCTFHDLETVFRGPYLATLNGVLTGNHFVGNGTINDLDGTWEHFEGNIGLRTQNSGQVRLSGDGSQTVFTTDWDGNPIQHELHVAPTSRTDLSLNTTPVDETAEMAAPVEAVPYDSTGNGAYDGIKFVFADPPTGGDSVYLTWEAKMIDI